MDPPIGKMIMRFPFLGLRKKVHGIQNPAKIPLKNPLLT
jgi:hypothetical protein